MVELEKVKEAGEVDEVVDLPAVVQGLNETVHLPNNYIHLLISSRQR